PLAADHTPVSSGGALELSAPRDVALGRDADAPLSMKKPATGKLALATSTGAIGAATDAGGGRLAASWHAPAAKFPQIAIVAAFAEDGTLLDWTRLRLLGAARVETHSKPFSSVAVTLGDASFGPIQADAKGNASFPVLVPATRVAPGGFESVLTAGADVLAGTIDVTATIHGDEASRAGCSLPLPGMPPVSVSAQAPPSHRAGGGTAVPVSVALAYRGTR